MFSFIACVLAVSADRADQQAIEKRVADTLSRMTLDEKIDILSGTRGFFERGVPRLGVPELRMSDGPAGVRNYGPTTAYPAPVCLAASFDKELAGAFGTAIGRDARSRGVHIWLGPGVNISRIPQNGRNFEYFGEDPYLAGQTVAHVVKAVQSQGVVATVKHFAANNYENDRFRDSSDVDERTLRELYLKPFEAAVEEGGAWAVMCAYNKLNGTYCSENPFLLTQVLRNDWGFHGVLMSDWGAVHSTLGPIKAGLDLEMPSGDFINRRTVKPLLDSGKCTVADLNEKVRRILRLTYAMGFDKQVQKDPTIPADDPRNEATSLQIAREGTVLLKNEGDLLPLGQSKRRILVVGPNAQPAVTGGGGSAYTTPATAVSLLEAIRHEAGPGVQVSYEPIFQSAQNVAFNFQDFTLPDGSGPGLLMERFNNMNLASTPSLVKEVKRVDIDEHFGDPNPPESHFSVRWTGTATFKESGRFMAVAKSDDGMRVYINDKLVIDDWNDHGEKVDMAPINVTAGRPYRVRVDYYQNEGEAVAQFGFYSVDAGLDQHLPINEIREADAIIAAVGFNPTLEGEGQDRPFELPMEQRLLLERMVDLNPHVVVVNNSGAGVDMSSWVDKAGAILQAWYPGGVGNRAIAEILFGKTNPSGKLPTTFPRTLQGTYYETAYPPVNGHLAYKEGLFMGYRWFDKNGVAPLFPFGFGLSYTTFRFEKFTVDPDRRNGIARLKVWIRNTGSRDGAETVQVYVHPRDSAVVRPEKELKAYQRVFLHAGERGEVGLSVKISDLDYFDVKGHKWVLEPGRYDLLVGSSSRDLPLSGHLDVGRG